MNSGLSLLLAGLGFAADRVSKDIAESKLLMGDISLFNGKIRLTKAENRGFALNTLEGNRHFVVSASSVIFLFAAGIYGRVLFKDTEKSMRLGMSLMMAGASGNVYDRTVKGYVIDFINIDVPCLKKIVFNLADVFIVVGAMLSIFGELLSEKRSKEE